MIAAHSVWQAGGVGRAPFALLARDAECGLHAANDEGMAALFSLEALCSLPALLLAPVGRSVFLEAAMHVLSEAVPQLLAAAKGSPRRERALHSFGYRLGIADFLSALTNSLREATDEPSVAVAARQVGTRARQIEVSISAAAAVLLAAPPAAQPQRPDPIAAVPKCPVEQRSGEGAETDLSEVDLSEMDI